MDNVAPIPPWQPAITPVGETRSAARVTEERKRQQERERRRRQRNSEPDSDGDQQRPHIDIDA